MKKQSPITIAAFAAGVICIIYYFVCGIAKSFTTSGLWIWLAFGLILLSGCVWKTLVEPKLLTSEALRLYKGLKGACLSLFALFLLIFFVFEGFLIKEWIRGNGNSHVSADAVIILGATVEYDRPGDTLEKRIGTAYELILKNPDAVVIACGGLGEGDIITEAQCIKNELIAGGIEENRIITEESSTSTAENFTYAASLLPNGAKRVAFVTSGFHQFRALTVGKASLESCGITDVTLIPVSSPCASVQLPCSMVREFAAFVKSLIHGNI